MKNNSCSILYLLLVCLACSCINPSKDKIVDLPYLNEIHGNQLKTLTGKKKLIYSMNSDCGYCISKLEYLESFFQENFGNTESIVVYAFSPSNNFEVLNYVIDQGLLISFSVFNDSSNIFRNLNQLSGGDSYMYVLDEENKMILEGDPSINNDLKNKYIDVFSK